MGSDGMLAGLLTVATIGAGFAATFAFVRSASRTPRLRRHEQFYRETLACLDRGDSRRQALELLHRETVAEVVARQLTPSWKFVAPWAVWVGVGAYSALAAHRLAVHLSEGGHWSTSELLEDPLALILLPFVFLGAFSLVFKFQIASLVHRWETAREFFDGDAIARLPAFRQSDPSVWISSSVKPAEDEADITLGHAQAKLRNFALYVLPGLSSALIGLAVGMTVWLEQQPGDRLEALASLGAFPGIAAAAMSLGLVLAVLIGTQVALVRRPFTFPGRYPTGARDAPEAGGEAAGT